MGEVTAAFPAVLWCSWPPLPAHPYYPHPPSRPAASAPAVPLAAPVCCLSLALTPPPVAVAAGLPPSLPRRLSCLCSRALMLVNIGHLMAVGGLQAAGGKCETLARTCSIRFEASHTAS